VTIGPSHEGDGVPKIGDGVFIVGAGAMISANSLVISDVPPGAFAVGVPAKAIRWSKPSNDTVAEAPTGAHAQGSVGSKDN
jgi:serine O-acetyltransferase